MSSASRVLWQGGAHRQGLAAVPQLQAGPATGQRAGAVVLDVQDGVHVGQIPEGSRVDPFPAARGDLAVGHKGSLQGAAVAFLAQGQGHIPVAFLWRHVVFPLLSQYVEAGPGERFPRAFLIRPVSGPAG